MTTIRYASLSLSLLAVTLVACSSAPIEEEQGHTESAYTSCDAEPLRRCQAGGGGNACFNRYCTTTPSTPSCYAQQLYTSLATGECKINTPGQSIPGRGLYLCDTTYCISNGHASEKPNSRRACHLVNCEVGTVCGDALC